MAKLNRIRVVLAERDLNNKWLSDKLGKDPATVSKWVTNTTQPSLEALIAIANALEVPVQELVRQEEFHQEKQSWRNKILHNRTTIIRTINHAINSIKDWLKNSPSVIISNLPSLTHSRWDAYTGDGKLNFPKPCCTPIMTRPIKSGTNKAKLPNKATNIFTSSFFQSLIGKPFKIVGWRRSFVTISIAKSRVQTINIVGSAPFNKRSNVWSAVLCSNNH